MILQFGTSRFLQAHFDLFAQEAAAHGQSLPGIVIVQTTGDPARAARLQGFSDPAGFPVIIRGLAGGEAIERHVQVRSVVEGLSVRTAWTEVCQLFTDRVTHIVSNTGDKGYLIADGDRDRAVIEGDAAPQSFPAILLALLHRRWSRGKSAPILLPCELVQRNGEMLQKLVAGLANDIGMDPQFGAWLDRECVWTNTLVDRIVSEPLEPAGAIAEPYALWAVERQVRLVMPFEHPDVIVTDDLEPYERLKLHILNLGHSWLAERWHLAGADRAATVRAMLDDPATLTALRDVYLSEVQPGFARRGLGPQAVEYAERTIERFANPYLDHRIADIHADHVAKIGKRVGGFARWVDDAGGDKLAMSQLRALASRYEKEEGGR